jgi:hypothetical protein
MKSIPIEVHCPDNDWRTERSSVVEISLAKIRCKYDLGKNWPFEKNLTYNIKIEDSLKRSVPFQVDRIDPYDSSKDVLFFDAQTNSRITDYYIVKGESENPEQKVSIKSKENNYDFELENNLIKLKFRRGEWLGSFGGSAHDIEFKKGNDTYYPFGSSYLNKFMQIENIYIPAQFKILGDRGLYPPDGYDYMASGEGPVRCYLAIKYPFDIEFEIPHLPGPGRFINQYKCFLYRIISLFYNKYYLKEEIFIRAESYRTLYTINGKMLELKEQTICDLVPIKFETKFFMNVPYIEGYSRNLQITGPNIRYEPNKITSPKEAWFAIGDNGHPNCPGIGFASNCQMNELPEKEFPRHGDAYRWLVSPTWHLSCLHQFLDRTNIAKENEDIFGGVIGNNWYNEIFTPLWCE